MTTTVKQTADNAGEANRVAIVARQRAKKGAAVADTAIAAMGQKYLEAFWNLSDAERNRQAVALRVRFETDREVERNVALKRDLVTAHEHGKRQKDLLRWTAIAFVAGAAAMAFLTYILITNFRHRRQLQELANHDDLTGLPNRRYMRELAAQALATATTAPAPFVMAIIDLDHFKTINDRFGHAAGDHVLREFARRSRDCLRETDRLGRWGGEEFLLIMPDTTLESALPILE